MKTFLLAASAAAAMAAAVALPAPTDLFPNAPSGGDWLTMADVVWTTPVPFRRDPVYEPDNGTHLVDYGDDDPSVDWPPQTAIVADSEVPGSVKTVLELRLPAGLAGGYGPSKVGAHPDYTGDGPLRWDPARSTGHLYVGFHVRFSPSFDLNGNVGQKILYLKSDLPENRSIAHMIGIMMNDGAGGNQLWPTYGPQSPFARYQTPEKAEWDLNDGRWHRVEFLQGPNTPGKANGTLRLWVDGRLAGEWANAVYFAPDHVPSVNRLEIAPIYGGGSNPVRKDQWIRLGPMRVLSR
jgi:hypothetical protein